MIDWGTIIRYISFYYYYEDDPVMSEDLKNLKLNLITEDDDDVTIKITLNPTVITYEGIHGMMETIVFQSDLSAGMKLVEEKLKLKKKNK